ncbi:MAG TPA: LON peptidase substrate-binding domain-containing protein [Actinocrinis sp.]|jgi:Lon protease-like protein|uniref:LON peptidase substrate-binding domain-containing protein n=1 Tax=Actinocrinis sp. TaxID=1920516 RepID=UPI002D5D56E8|nr:LON peptidase substrate-binding domain-containing protein [Actinocrinis sp.]HZU56255.1 LON peptidase substrate-binding domain-containing protein [Actinocrinis sp.]
MATTLPLFPLGSVLFPGVVLPLHIFEPRYRKMVADLRELPEGEARQFGVVAIRDGREVGAQSVESVYDVGCTARISALEAHDDGRYSLVTTGVQRFRLLDVDTSGAYLIGEVEYLEEPSDARAEALKTSSTALLLGYQRALAGLRGVRTGSIPELPDDPTVLSYLIAAAMVLDLRDKQRLLATPDTASRLQREQALLRRETLLIKELRTLPAVDLLRRDR